MKALLVIDMQEDFFDDDPLKTARKNLTSYVNKLIGIARSQDVPIIWVWQEFEEDLSDAFLIMRKDNISKTIRGSFGSQILSELDKQTTDHEVIKKRYSAFYNTDLYKLLSSLGVTHLVIAGINTHACVRMTAIDAYQRDFEVSIPRDCVLSPDTEHHYVTLRYLGYEIANICSIPESFQ